MRSRILEAVAVVVVLALAAVGLVATRGPGGRRITAYFTLATGVYAGSDVRVLGVRVGSVDAVRPVGAQVRVTMTVDHGVAIPASARAVVVAPGLVADRYVQLTPVYTTGPAMPAGASIPADRTATPLEINQLYDNVTKLADELGPNGVNKNGALSDVLNTAARNLDGNGADLGATIQNLGEAAKTLTGSQGDLFTTVDNLSKFTTMLAGSDSQVRQAETQLDSVAAFLSADRADLGGALRELATALVKVKSFIQDNRGALADDLGKLASVTQVVVNQRKALAEALDAMPLNAQNLMNAYDSATHRLMGRADITELAPPPLVLPNAGGSR